MLIGDCNLDGDNHRFIKNSMKLYVVKSSLMPFAHKSNPKIPTAKMGVDRNLGPSAIRYGRTSWHEQTEVVKSTF